jgi:hypothetical protein
MRRLLLLAVLATASCFRPNVPSGKVSCTLDSDCPGGLSCQAASIDPGGGRLCCGRLGCGGTSPVADAAPPVDAPPRPDAPVVALPDGAIGSGEVPRPDAGVVTPVPDAAPMSPDTAPGSDVAAMVTCAKPVTTAFAPGPGRKSYCTVGVQDTRVMLNLDLIDNDNELTISSFQVCQVPLDLAAKTAPLPGQAPPPLLASDIQLVAAIAGYYQTLCTSMHVDNFVGVYATAWGRQAPNIGDVNAAVKARTGVELEVLNTQQETTQRYLGAAGNRRRYLVLHARGNDLLLTSWPDGDAGPSEVIVPTNMRIANDRFFGNTNYFQYSTARRDYEDAIDTDLSGQLTTWRTQMNSDRLIDNLIFDGDDATFVLALRNELRNNNTWDDVETFNMKLAAASATMTVYGWSFGVIPGATLQNFGESIFNNREFTQLRSEPVKSAYGLEVMALAGFVHELRFRLPLGEMGAVSVNASYGYVFRKLFMPR